MMGRGSQPRPSRAAALAPRKLRYFAGTEDGEVEDDAGGWDPGLAGAAEGAGDEPVGKGEGDEGGDEARVPAGVEG